VAIFGQDAMAPFHAFHPARRHVRHRIVMAVVACVVASLSLIAALLARTA
jgi:hypothetical protein